MSVTPPTFVLYNNLHFWAHFTQVCCANIANDIGSAFISLLLKGCALEPYPKNNYHNLRLQNIFIMNEWQKASIVVLVVVI